MRLHTPRPTSFSLEQYKEAIESRAHMFSRYGSPLRSQVDDRPWVEPDRGVTEKPTDKMPVYLDITNQPIVGSPAGIVGLFNT